MTHRSFSRAAFALAACSAAIVGFSTARAADFSAEYVFGDSLSDNGNLAGLIGAFPHPPSFDNSFTNGPVAVQLLAQSLGLSANASLWLTSPSSHLFAFLPAWGLAAPCPRLSRSHLITVRPADRAVW